MARSICQQQFTVDDKMLTEVDKLIIRLSLTIAQLEQAFNEQAKKLAELEQKIATGPVEKKAAKK